MTVYEECVANADSKKQQLNDKIIQYAKEILPMCNIKHEAIYSTTTVLFEQANIDELHSIEDFDVLIHLAEMNIDSNPDDNINYIVNYVRDSCGFDMNKNIQSIEHHYEMDIKLCDSNKIPDINSDIERVNEEFSNTFNSMLDEFYGNNSTLVAVDSE